MERVHIDANTASEIARGLGYRRAVICKKVEPIRGSGSADVEAETSVLEGTKSIARRIEVFHPLHRRLADVQGSQCRQRMRVCAFSYAWHRRRCEVRGTASPE